jgi:Ca2+-binding RTX toxin-like protein
VVPNVGLPGISEGFFDVIRGGLGDDTIWGGSGLDGILGGFGADTIYGFVPPSYELYPYVSILTDAPNDIYGGPGNDTISAGDSLFGHWVNGGGGDDTITGAALPDELLGGAGNDVISGKGGSDWIRGGAGNDTLYGDDSTPTSTSGDEIGGKSGDDMIMGSNGSDTPGTPTLGTTSSPEPPRITLFT